MLGISAYIILCYAPDPESFVLKPLAYGFIPLTFIILIYYLLGEKYHRKRLITLIKRRHSNNSWLKKYKIKQRNKSVFITINIILLFGFLLIIDCHYLAQIKFNQDVIVKHAECVSKKSRKSLTKYYIHFNLIPPTFLFENEANLDEISFRVNSCENYRHIAKLKNQFILLSGYGGGLLATYYKNFNNDILGY